MARILRAGSQILRAGGAGGGPVGVAGCALWLDASAIVGLANNDPVSAWADLSGNGRNVTQSTASAKPTYKTGVINNRPALLFDGGDYLAHSTASTWRFLHDGSAAAVFAVVSATDVAVAHGIVATSSNSSSTEVGYGLSTTTNARAIAYIQLASANGAITTVTGNNAIAQSTPCAIVCLSDADATPAADRIAVYINGGSAYKTNSNALTPSTAEPSNALHVGCRAFSGGNPVALFAGHIAEILIYSAALSAADTNTVGAYLATKWGLTWSNIS